MENDSEADANVRRRLLLLGTTNTSSRDRTVKWGKLPVPSSRRRPDLICESSYPSGEDGEANLADEKAIVIPGRSNGRRRSYSKSFDDGDHFVDEEQFEDETSTSMNIDNFCEEIDNFLKAEESLRDENNRSSTPPEVTSRRHPAGRSRNNNNTNESSSPPVGSSSSFNNVPSPTTTTTTTTPFFQSRPLVGAPVRRPERRRRPEPPSPRAVTKGEDETKRRGDGVIRVVTLTTFEDDDDAAVSNGGFTKTTFDDAAPVPGRNIRSDGTSEKSEYRRRDDDDRGTTTASEGRWRSKSGGGPVVGDGRGTNDNNNSRVVTNRDPKNNNNRRVMGDGTKVVISATKRVRYPHLKSTTGVRTMPVDEFEPIIYDRKSSNDRVSERRGGVPLWFHPIRVIDS